ncbi:MAG: hypothetical protein KA319_00560 [Ferruginibacter sp.]|nr:hypothetical protein [Ferruginibacter sp.]
MCKNRFGKATNECGIDFVFSDIKYTTMSTLEKKALAFEKLAKLQEESAITEILEHLEKLTLSQSKLDTEAFFKKAQAKYGDVLQKLAQ